MRSIVTFPLLVNVTVKVNEQLSVARSLWSIAFLHLHGHLAAKGGLHPTYLVRATGRSALGNPGSISASKARTVTTAASLDGILIRKFREMERVLDMAYVLIADFTVTSYTAAPVTGVQVARKIPLLLRLPLTLAGAARTVLAVKVPANRMDPVAP